MQREPTISIRNSVDVHDSISSSPHKTAKKVVNRQLTHKHAKTKEKINSKKNLIL
jgi:hypothetical protein